MESNQVSLTATTSAQSLHPPQRCCPCPQAVHEHYVSVSASEYLYQSNDHPHFTYRRVGLNSSASDAAHNPPTPEEFVCLALELSPMYVRARHTPHPRNRALPGSVVRFVRRLSLWFELTSGVCSSLRNDQPLYTHREHEATYRRRLGWRPSKRTVIRFVPVPEDIMRHTTRRITNAASGLEVRHCGRSRGCWDGLKWRTVSSFLDPVRSQGLLLPYQKDQGMCQQSSVHRSLHRKSSQSVRSLSKRREVSMMGQRKMDQVGWQGAYGEASGCW